VSIGQKSDFLDDLNTEQKEAVLYNAGPLVVLAGAGSGKTRVLTRRIAYLIEEGVRPEQILAITFTNKAAQEMKSRVYDLIGEVSLGMWISTFHSACVRILRRNAGRIGFTPSFSIYDDSESRKLIEIIIDQFNLDPKRHSPRAIAQIISAAKNEMRSSSEYFENVSNEFEKRVSRIFFEYQKRLQEANAFDFDDLLLKTVELLKANEDLAAEYQDRFRHLLVDEYQDTNRAQNDLVAIIGSGSGNVCVVGDTDQSIYAFRGADFRNLLNFNSIFPNAKTIILNQNYRSTQTILNAANAIIDNNEARVKKQLWSALGEGEKIKLFRAGDERHEAVFVADEIVRLSSYAISSYANVAIFYRTNAQSRAIEEALVDRDIPYRMIGGVRFFDRKEVKDILAYMRLIDNIKDEISLRRIINVPKRKVGAKTLMMIDQYCEEHSLTFYEALLQIDNCPVPKAAKSGVHKFLKDLSDLREMHDRRPKEIMEEVLRITSYKDSFLEEIREAGQLADQALIRLEIIDELLSVALEYDDLESFLSSTSLLTPSDDLDETTEAVTMMTIHGAKGLEFDTVFLTGMEEGLFPHDRALSDPDALEEERRLCYVGITRAKKYLYLTNTYTRTIFGRTLDSLPSRFIRELPKEILTDMSVHNSYHEMNQSYSRYFEEEPEGFIFGSGNLYRREISGYRNYDTGRPGRPTAADNKISDNLGIDNRSTTAGKSAFLTSRSTEEIDAFHIGDKIMHTRYGKGIIEDITGDDEKKVAVISFPNRKPSKFLLAAAPITLLGR